MGDFIGRGGSIPTNRVPGQQKSAILTCASPIGTCYHLGADFEISLEVSGDLTPETVLLIPVDQEHRVKDKQSFPAQRDPGVHRYTSKKQNCMSQTANRTEIGF